MRVLMTHCVSPLFTSLPWASPKLRPAVISTGYGVAFHKHVATTTPVPRQNSVRDPKAHEQLVVWVKRRSGSGMYEAFFQITSCGALVLRDKSGRTA